uniref:Uncharacterized protein n=1 Tax=Arundo donax TaxID=35708 RepID=A0A0A8Y6F1_ARUDO
MRRKKSLNCCRDIAHSIIISVHSLTLSIIHFSSVAY